MKTQIAMRSEQAMSSGLITSAENRNFLPGFLYFRLLLTQFKLLAQPYRNKILS